MDFHRFPSLTSTSNAIPLRNLVYNCAALAIGFGFTGSQELTKPYKTENKTTPRIQWIQCSQDTLVTQAFGSNRLELCELYLHRCQAPRLFFFPTLRPPWGMVFRCLCQSDPLSRCGCVVSLSSVDPWLEPWLWNWGVFVSDFAWFKHVTYTFTNVDLEKYRSIMHPL